MGEPFMNYKNTEKFCYSVTNKYHNLRSLCVSTVGIPHRIKDISSIAANISALKLSVSIHSPYDEERSLIIPIAKKYSISSILSACRFFHEKTSSKITLSYLLLDGVNNSEKHANDFAKLIIKDDFFTVRLLLCNKTPGIPFLRPTNESALQFKNILLSHGVDADIQISKGQDVEGGCGQFVRNYAQPLIKYQENVEAVKVMALDLKPE